MLLGTHGDYWIGEVNPASIKPVSDSKSIALHFGLGGLVDVAQCESENARWRNPHQNRICSYYETFE
jgi:hypothetical protein